MEEFEQHIRNSLARKEPSPWLEAKILAAAEDRRPRRLGRLRWVSAVAGAAVLIMGIAWQRERAIQERVAGEAAKERLKLALRITSEKLRKIQREVVDRND